MSFFDVKQQKEAIVNDVKIDMPTIFDSKQEYLDKLEEMLEKEAVIARLNVETIAEAGVEFQIDEILDIYCKMTLRVPKTHQQHFREYAMLRVVIPIVQDPRDPHAQNYIGTGVIKRVVIRAKDPFLTITFQLDVVNPTNKSQLDQKIPKKEIQYGQTLDLRLICDSKMVESHKQTVKNNLSTESADLTWPAVNYKVQSIK